MKTDNELIAEFMGAIRDNGNAPIYLMPKPIGKFPAHIYKLREMEFDTSWDWLMPVVETIAQYRLEYPVECDTVCNCKIVVGKKYLYEKVINFIKFYNDKHQGKIKS